MRNILLKSIILLAVSAATSLLSNADERYARCPAGTTEQIIVHKAYTVSYNQDRLAPNWVAWELVEAEVNGEFSRTNEFLPDPDIKGRTALTQDFSRSGYDRGHMMPAADCRWDRTAMEESFYLSNVCAQDRTLNSDTWCELEKRCRYWAYRYSPIYIIAGPLWGDNPRKLGANGVSVPSGFFKIVCKTFKGRPEAIAFVFPNSPCSDDFRNYACSVADVERLTGMQFLVNLPAEQRTKVNATYDLQWWK